MLVRLGTGQPSLDEESAAITEVYRRMQVARELDMLMNNAAEAALLERIVQVREDVEQSGQAAESGMDKKVQRLSGMHSYYFNETLE